MVLPSLLKSTQSPRWLYNQTGHVVECECGKMCFDAMHSGVTLKPIQSSDYDTAMTVKTLYQELFSDCEKGNSKNPESSTAFKFSIL